MARHFRRKLFPCCCYASFEQVFLLPLRASNEFFPLFFFSKSKKARLATLITSRMKEKAMVRKHSQKILPVSL